MNLTKTRERFCLDSYSALNSIRFERVGSLPGSQRKSLLVSNEEREKGTSGVIMSQVHWILNWKRILNLREKGFVLETLCLRMVVSGRTFGDYLLLSDLRFLFRDSTEDFYQQRLITVADILLDERLSWEMRKRTVNNLYDSFGTDLRRKYGNLKKTWSPEENLSLREIPLETYIDLTSKGVPYSSYCKGYGEGSARGLKKTPYSSELDGEDDKAEKNLDFRIYKLFSVLKSTLLSLKRKELLARKQ